MNALKGEVGFEAAGVAYTLVYDINVICIIETKTGLKVRQLVAELLGDASLTITRSVFWGGLITKHPAMTLQDAGTLMGAVKVKRANALMVEALALGFPQDEEDGESADRP
jgi:hypothetical protein